MKIAATMALWHSKSRKPLSRYISKGLAWQPFSTMIWLLGKEAPRAIKRKQNNQSKKVKRAF